MLVIDAFHNIFTTEYTRLLRRAPRRVTLFSRPPIVLYRTSRKLQIYIATPVENIFHQKIWAIMSEKIVSEKSILAVLKKVSVGLRDRYLANSSIFF